MKLWQKNTSSLKEVEKFTVGNDREFDLLLAPFDVLGSIAHAKMLESIGLLTNDEASALVKELKNIYATIQDSRFSIDEKVEDIHSEIEMLLTQKLGDTGKKIHSARSRNDQVLLDIKLFLRNEIEKLVKTVQVFLISFNRKVKNIKMTCCLVILICNLPCLHHLGYGLELMPKAWWMI